MIFDCPECGHELKCMVVFGADETMSGHEERLMHCENYLSSWELIGEDCAGNWKIQRYFFG